MAKFNRSWIMFGVSTGVLAAGIVLAGMTNYRAPAPDTSADPVPEVAKKFSALVLNAKDDLVSELNRRFTDRQNVDFGMSRVVREGRRLHVTPLMNITPKHSLRNDSYRKKDDGTYEALIEGDWVPALQVKPLMVPENDTERGAIAALRHGKVDVAIYTLGQFELDKGEKPAPDPKTERQSQPHYQGFQWGNYASLRAKGPAYVSQKGATAPRAYEIVDFGRKAWASKKVDYAAEGKDGWVYFAHRVAAPDMSCASCHGNRKTWDNKQQIDVKGSVQAAGDPVGIFIVALRKA
jgi:hypothetical protein